MTSDMFGTPESVYKEEIARLNKKVSDLESDRPVLVSLYHKVNDMMGQLGADGEINTLDPLVQDVMDTLHEIDGGTYDEEFE